MRVQRASKTWWIEAVSFTPGWRAADCAISARTISRVPAPQTLCNGPATTGMKDPYRHRYRREGSITVTVDLARGMGEVTSRAGCVPFFFSTDI